MKRTIVIISLLLCMLLTAGSIACVYAYSYANQSGSNLSEIGYDEEFELTVPALDPVHNFSSKCGDTLRYRYEWWYEQTDSGILEISGGGDMYDYTAEKPLWTYSYPIGQLVINEGTTSIGDYALYNCTSLTENITLPNSITRIGENAFFNTPIYTNEENWDNGSLYIGKWLIKVGTSISGEYTIKDGTIGIADGAFAKCSEITGINFPNSLAYIGNKAFTGCFALSDIILTSNIKSIGNQAFWNCLTLKSITIENPDCIIYDNYQTISGSATIYGHLNSTAHLYAGNYNRNFSVIEDSTEPTSDVTTPTTTTETTATDDNSIPEEVVTTGDMDGDGTLTIKDATIIQKILAGLISY